MGSPEIRKAKLSDVPAMQALIKKFADKGKMLPRSATYIGERIRDFYVLDDGDELLGVCAMRPFWEGPAEVYSLAVVESLSGQGYGRKMVAECLAEAKRLGIGEVFALTKVREFFTAMGFKEIKREELPRKIWTECVNCPKFPDCDEQAVILKL